MAKKNVKGNQKDNSKNKKSFMKDFKAELKKVTWPTAKQLANNTVAVVTIVLITAAIVFVLDLTFEAINKNGVDKIKEFVVTSSDTTDENATTEETNSDENVIGENTTSETSETSENVTEESTAENTVE